MNQSKTKFENYRHEFSQNKSNSDKREKSSKKPEEKEEE
jgi:hypothetical protein